MKLKITKIAFLTCVLVVSVPLAYVQAEEREGNSLRAKTDARINADAKLGDRKLGDKKVETRNNIMIKRDIKKDSDTGMFKKLKDQRSEIMKKMQRGAFETRRTALSEKLKLTIENLSNIRARISDRVSKLETEGKVVTEAKANLAIADDKLAKAKVAVNAFVALKADATSNTDEVELEKPRKAADEALKAVREARDAFKKVVSDIIKIIRADLEVKINN